VEYLTDSFTEGFTSETPVYFAHLHVSTSAQFEQQEHSCWSFQLRALPPHLLPSLRASFSRVVRSHSPSSTTQKLVKKNAFPLSLTHMFGSSLVFIHFSKEKAFLLLPEIKVCPCLHCVILFQSHYFNLASFRGCRIQFLI